MTVQGFAIWNEPAAQVKSDRRQMVSVRYQKDFIIVDFCHDIAILMTDLSVVKVNVDENFP